jgi:hypothetical protein
MLKELLDVGTQNELAYDCIKRGDKTVSCIGWPREADPDLHDLYAKHLLEPGWAGEVDDAEAAYIARELTKRPALRRVWQVAKFTRRRRSITPAMAKKMAHWWAGIATEAAQAQLSGTVDWKKRASRRNSSARPTIDSEAKLSSRSCARPHRKEIVK